MGGINCLPDTAFEQMEETKNIFHKTGKRPGYHVIISFSPEEKVTAEQAMYVLEHFAKDVLSDDYEAVYAVHTDREHMHGHLIWNSVSMTTGKKYNSPKSNWKNHLQPITNKYCDELGLSIMPAEYSRNPKNISRDKWEKEMSMKEIILRDAKMCAYAAGNVEHFKYLMKRLGYVFKKDAWMEVQAPGFRYYHKLAKLDEMFSEDMLWHYVDMPWMAKPYFYSSDIRGLHRAKLSPFQKKFYAKLYRLRVVEQKRFVVGGAKYAEDLKRFHQLQYEYLLLVNNDIKSVVELVDFISEQEEKIQQIEDRQHEIYRESSSRKRNIKNEEQYREYQIWHVEAQEELDELKQEKRNIKRQVQLADDIIKEDLYTVYYAVSGKELALVDFFLPHDSRVDLLKKTEVDYTLTSTNQYILSDENSIIISSAEKDNVDGLIYDENTPEGDIIMFTATANECDKPVVLSIDNILNAVMAINSRVECTSDDIVLAQIPLHNEFGFIYSLIWPLYNGAMVCIGRGLRHVDADTYYYNPTILIGTPSMIDYQRAISGFNKELNTIIIGGASCPFRLFENLCDSDLKVYNIYGMTETSGCVGVNELYDGSYTLFDNNAVSIADDGEIIVSGPCVMKGYYNDGESTENVLKDGVYHTGDYGRINNVGRLVLLQRNPDIILLPTGEKISRVRTNEQITAINGVAEGFITFYNNRLTAVIVPIDKSASEDIFKRRIDKYNEKKGYRWEIQKIVLRKEPLPRNSDGTVDEEAVCELIGD